MIHKGKQQHPDTLLSELRNDESGKIKLFPILRMTGGGPPGNKSQLKTLQQSTLASTLLQQG